MDVRKWFHDFSAQYAAGIAVVATLAVIGGAAAIAYWAFTSVTGPALATIMFCLAVAVFLGLCGALWLKDRGDRSNTVAVPTSAELAKTNDEIWARAKEQIEGRDEVIRQKDEITNKLSQELAETKKALVSSHRLYETQQVQISVPDGQIANLEPMATWVKALIDRERSAPTDQLIRRHFFLSRERYLAAAEAEPYFDIDVLVDYVGALRLVVETTQVGNLSWNDRAFAIVPKVMQSQFEGEGPTSCELKIRQHVSKDKAAELKTEIEANGGLRLLTGGLRISATLKDYAGASVRVLESILGDSLEIKPRP